MISFSVPNGLELCLMDNVWEQLLRIQNAGMFTSENGGILIGLLNPAENQIVITDCTDAKETDIRSRFHFFRSEKGHQSVMDDLWRASDFTKTYLGEWHSHDENVPSPSYVDIKGWKKISKREHNTSHLFFVIVGRQEIGVWTIINEKPYKLINQTKTDGK